MFFKLQGTIFDQNEESNKPKTWPSSATTVRTHVINNWKKKKNLLIEKLDKKRDSGHRGSITMDEYQSKGCKKYLNANFHSHDITPRNLGLKRCLGSLPAHTLRILLEDHLSTFNISLKQTTALVTDGASVCVKLGRLVDCLHLQCQAHGINLGVCDIIFKKPDSEDEETQLDTTQVIEINYDNGQASQEEDYDSPAELDHSDEISPHETQYLPDICEEFKSPVDKLRIISGKFTNSSKRKDFLDEQIKANHNGKSVTLQKDVCTRWNSTKHMISVALPVMEQIRYACWKLKLDFDLTEDDIKKLEELNQLLEPLEYAINKLGKEKMNLLDAEAVYETVYEQLSDINSEMATVLKESFFKRVDQRRPATLLHLMEFLEDPNYITKQEDWFGHQINKSDIFQLADEQIRRLFEDDVKSETDLLMDVDEEGDCVFSEEEKEGKKLTLDERVEKKLKKKNEDKRAKTGKKGAQYVKDLCQNYARGGNPRDIPVLLGKLLNALKSIPPTSVQCERAFSTTGQYATKIRSNLNDETLSSLVFLKYYNTNKQD